MATRQDENKGAEKDGRKLKSRAQYECISFSIHVLMYHWLLLIKWFYIPNLSDDPSRSAIFGAQKNLVFAFG